MKQETINKIIELIKKYDETASDMKIDANTKLSSVSGIDSMSMVNIQLDLIPEFGKKAENLEMSADLSVGDIAERLS